MTANTFSDGLRDVHPPVGIPGEWLWLWALLLLFFLLGVFWAVKLFLRRTKVLPLEAVKPSWVIAMEALDALERAGMAEKGQVKEHYSALTGIVRQYIESRFRIRAPEMTTEEFLAHAGSSTMLTPDHRGFLEEFLAASDLVKFARFIPGLDDMRSAVSLARKFVEETREITVTEDNKPSGA
jgi:hypothetical protein